MIYSSKTYTLKNNISAILRSPTKEDAAQMLAYLETVCTETNFLTREPEETKIPLEKEEHFLDGICQSDDNLMIACEIDGEIIGNCSLNRYTMQRMRHRAGIGIAICKKFWGIGIAGLMLNELIEIAKQLDVKQLELEVISDNVRAIKLYQKFGFEIIGKRPNALHLKDGTELHELMMVKIL